jgi:hypothetical protein
MTQQVSDIVMVDGVEYSVTGVGGTGLFDVAEHGIEPGMMSTGCWRGHHCRYAVLDARLVLVRLLLGHGAKVAGREVAVGDALLGGSVADAGDHWFGARFSVGGMHHPVPFTGTLLLGRDVVSYPPHMGYAAAWRFAHVLELTVADGAVTATRDLSEQMAETRRAIEQGDADDPDGSKDDLSAWIARTFDLGLDRSPIPPPTRPPGLPPQE